MCDGGAGALAALGVAFYDRNGTSIPHPTGGDLQRIERLQIPADFQHCVKGMHFTYACDVTNPLTGPEGASAVFGPQKGASREDVTLLDGALRHVSSVIERALAEQVPAERNGDGGKSKRPWLNHRLLPPFPS